MSFRNYCELYTHGSHCKYHLMVKNTTVSWKYKRLFGFQMLRVSSKQLAQTSQWWWGLNLELLTQVFFNFKLNLLRFETGYPTMWKALLVIIIILNHLPRYCILKGLEVIKHLTGGIPDRNSLRRPSFYRWNSMVDLDSHLGGSSHNLRCFLQREQNHINSISHKQPCLKKGTFLWDPSQFRNIDWNRFHAIDTQPSVWSSS